MLAHRRLFSTLFVSALLVTSASPALAEPSLSDRETARSLMDDGDAKRDKGDFKAALKSYEAADAIMHVPTTGLEVARIQAQLGLLLEARETSGRVARLPAKPGEHAAMPAARKAAESFNAEIGARIPSVTVLVANAEPGQTPSITFDGEPVPPAASQAPRKVNPGKHTIVVRAGTVEKTAEITVAERESKTATIDLSAKAIEPPREEPTPAGPSEPSSLPKVLIFGGFALGAIGLGVGTITGLVSISKVEDVKKDCNGDVCPRDRQGDIDSAKSLGTVSTIAFIAGGVGVAAGVVGLIMKGGQSKEATTARAPGLVVQPQVGPTWLGLHGAF